jgi:hypothetical protein
MVKGGSKKSCDCLIALYLYLSQHNLPKEHLCLFRKISFEPARRKFMTLSQLLLLAKELFPLASIKSIRLNVISRMQWQQYVLGYT